MAMEALGTRPVLFLQSEAGLGNARVAYMFAMTTPNTRYLQRLTAESEYNLPIGEVSNIPSLVELVVCYTSTACIAHNLDGYPFSSPNTRERSK